MTVPPQARADAKAAAEQARDALQAELDALQQRLAPAEAHAAALTEEVAALTAARDQDGARVLALQEELDALRSNKAAMEASVHNAVATMQVGCFCEDRICTMPWLCSVSWRAALTLS